MDWYEILYGVYLAINLVCWVVVGILTFTGKIKKNTVSYDENLESVEIDTESKSNLLLDLANKVTSWVEKVENDFAEMTSSGKLKLGVFKLSQVQSMIKDYCAANNLDYDSNVWESLINKCVELINYNNEVKINEGKSSL